MEKSINSTIPKAHWALFFVAMLSAILIRLFAVLEWRCAGYAAMVIAGICVLLFAISYILKSRHKDLSFHIYHCTMFLLMILLLLTSLARQYFPQTLTDNTLVGMGLILAILFTTYSYWHLKQVGHQTYSGNMVLLFFVQNIDENEIWWTCAFAILYPLLVFGI